MAVDAALPIEAIGKSRLEPLHARDEVPGGRFHGEVEMISHDDKRVEGPATSFARLE